jgi:hypothetical protein
VGDRVAHVSDHVHPVGAMLFDKLSELRFVSFDGGNEVVSTQVALS